MEAFELMLGSWSRLRVRGAIVDEMSGGTPGSWDVGSVVAACAAFEHRLAALRRRGLAIELPGEPPWAEAARLVREEPDDPAAVQLLAEAMRAAGDRRAAAVEAAREPSEAERAELFGCVDEAARALTGTFGYEPRAGLVRRAFVADADEVGLCDGLMPTLHAADPRALGFDPRAQPLEPHTLAVHALRRVLLHPTGRFLPELRLEVSARLDPFVEALDELGRADAATHLTLMAPPDRALGQLLPGLTALACPSSLVERCLRAPAPALVSLAVGVRTRDVARVLASLPSTRLASLGYLGLRGEPADPAGCEACLDSPLVPRLHTLDLGATRPMDEASYALLASRPSALAHLERLVLPAAPASLAARELFARWPNVVWADPNREGLRDLDRTVVAGAGFGGFNFGVTLACATVL